uniref:Glucosamine 6-phosphate N-acetyltransferase n=1 Tax=Evadne anonyx TaxID=141404 RepID=A0A9N6ZEB1_9CRUS|nr:EOG090X0FKI [Evadne anonyx]
MAEELSLYDPELLDKFDLGERYKVLKKDPVLKVRPLLASDYSRGFLNLLKELTEVGDITQEQFEDQFGLMRSSPGMYYVTVIVDQNKNEIVGAATLLMERKFIRQLAMRARIEDVVVSPNYRGKQLGKCIIELLIKLGQELGAYKISLDCKDQMIPFYVSLGFKQEEGNSNCLSLRYSKSHH